MPLIESNFPFVNQHGLNMDWILNKIKEFNTTITEYGNRLDVFQTTLDGLSADYANLANTVTGIRTDLNTVSASVASLSSTVSGLSSDINDPSTGLKKKVQDIETALTSIGGTISSLTSRIEEVNDDSISRDNNLGNRISILESAVINPVNLYYSQENLIACGNDFRNVPTWSEPVMGKTLPYPWYCDNDYTTVEYDSNSGFYLSSGYFSEIRYKENDVAGFQGYGSLSQTMTVTAIMSTNTNPGNDLYTVDCTSGNRQMLNTAYYSLFDDRIRVSLGVDGSVGLRLYNADYSNYWTTHRLVALKIEVGDTSTGIKLNSKEAVIMKYAKQYVDSKTSTVTHYTGDIEFTVGTLTTSPELTWLDSPYFTASVDLYKDGNIVMGSIKFVLGGGQTEAITMTDLVTTAKTINVSSLHLPATKNPGCTLGTYCNLVDREQYFMYGNNTSTELTSITFYPYFVSKTTTADGTIITLPVAYVC